MAKQQRGNAYYLGLVAKRHPAIYAQYLAGHYTNASAAILAAGVKQPPKARHVLLRAWREATEAERAAFLAEIGVRRVPVATASRSSSIATSEGKLTEHAKRRFKALFPMQPFPCGYVMSAIGRPTTDVSLRHAISSGYKLQPELIAKLQVWLPAEEARLRALVEE